METARRYLVLTPVAFGVTLVLALGYMLLLGPIGAAELGMALGFALGTTVAALLFALLAAGLLRLLGVRNDWITLSLAVALVAVTYAIGYVGAAPWRLDEAEWGLLLFTFWTIGVIPSLLTYAVGALFRGRSGRELPRTGEA